MHNIEQYNTPGYETRTSPTAVIIWEYQGELYTVLVQNLGSTKGYVMPNGGINEGETPGQGALRELNEETGAILTPGVQLVHMGSLGILHRKAGTDPKNDVEVLLLDIKLAGEKFLFIKQQLYELFVVRSQLDQQLSFNTANRDSDIQDVIIVALSDVKQHIQIESDRAIADILNQHHELLRDLIKGSNKDISNLQTSINNINNRIFE